MAVTPESQLETKWELLLKHLLLSPRRVITSIRAADEMGYEYGHPVRTQETWPHIGQTRTITFTYKMNLQGTVAGAWQRREVFGDEDNTWKMDCFCERLSPALRSESCQGRYMLVKPQLGLCFVFVLLLTFCFQSCTYKSDLKS